MTKKSPAKKSARALAPIGSAYNVQAQAARAFAAPGNSAPANILVLVTDPATGKGIADLAQANVQVVNHMSIPGATCGFSGQIVTFHSVGSGAYQITVKPKDCKWVNGEYLGQIMVAKGTRAGQAAFKLSIQ